jgi:hypothetical protein
MKWTSRLWWEWKCFRRSSLLTGCTVVHVWSPIAIFRHLCALVACLQHAVQDEWQRVGANMTTEVSPLRLKALVCFLTSVHHFYSIYCLSWHALPYSIFCLTPLTTDKFMVSYLGQYHTLVPVLYGEESFCSTHTSYWATRNCVSTITARNHVIRLTTRYHLRIN